ncbi:class I fructose-bisphosphate aldolase [Thalassospiraceae bacterium LMO-JJ14]|nr:class I fructose-bisphosphate aldolase [Thalassospiraceae bacterium LMO-JJ14]
MNKQELFETAVAMVADNKGLLAADESTGTMGKRLDSIGVENVEENRRDYREMMFRSSGIGNYISGVILYDETIRQSAADGTTLVKILQDAGVIPGIKVDGGAKELPGRPAEKITEGLDGLPGRVAEYYGLGARFAKWRAVIDIADGIPSRYAIHTNAHALARYAKICQEGGLCPIVEPEVLMDGAHDISRCQEVTEEVLEAVYHELHLQEVYLEGTILKPNMIISGKKCATQAAAEEVASKTVETLLRCVPAAVPGIMFLSGGQSEEDATLHLDLMNAGSDLPWKLSFSYGRALQQSALSAWKGDNANNAAAQQAFLERASANSRACAGTYSKAA